MPFAAAYKIFAWNQENQKINIAKEKSLFWDFNKKVVLHLQKPNKYDILQSGVRGVQVSLYQQQTIKELI